MTERAFVSEEPSHLDLEGAREVMARLTARLNRAVLGRENVVELLVVAVLADGHVLLEDYPGSGKTTLAKALGESIVDDRAEDELPVFRRVQFTPDLLPSDVTGTMIFDPVGNHFYFRPGPIFTYVLLADEINRTSPKVQSALLEAMAEKQVTVDNRSRPLDPLFTVVATQNPLDLAGTFPLPVAQLDRFLFKIRMRHIRREAELAILSDLEGVRKGPVDLPRVERGRVLAARRAVQEQVHVAPAVREALVDLAQATRDDERVLQGLSTRALVLLVPALQARAVLRGRGYVSSEDLEALALPVLGHRLEVAAGAEPVDKVLADCLVRPLEGLARATLRR